MPGLTIGKLAAGEGVGVETVRYYQRRGLLGQPERRGSATASTPRSDRARLVFSSAGPAAGFHAGGDRRICSAVAEANSAAEIAIAAQAKVAAVDEQLRELELLRCRLRRLLHVCAHGSGEDCAALQLGERT